MLPLRCDFIKIQINHIRRNEIVSLFEDLHVVPLEIIHIVHMQYFPKTNIRNPCYSHLRLRIRGLELFVFQKI